MRSRLTALLLCLCLMLPLLLGACDSVAPPVHQEDTHVVTFYADGVIVSQRTVAHGATVSPPHAPQKNNLIFVAWVSAPSGGYEYDFSVAVTTDLYLYASYIPDAISITNQITTSAIRGVVQVENKSYNDNKFLGFVIGRKDEQTRTGSGVIIHVSGNTAYMLTNCHVAAPIQGREHAELSVVDYRGHSYSASVFRAEGYAGAIDPAYDLALLVFQFDSSDPLVAFDFAPGDPESNQHVIAVGHPKGQSNAIAYGRTVGYYAITLQNTAAADSNVKFDVLRHTAFIDSGSSGGPLLDTDLRIVGINYAADDTDPFTYAYAIPVSRVREFLQKYGFL